jgi:hypothetical protein
MKVNWDHYSQYMEKMFQTTNQFHMLPTILSISNDMSKMATTGRLNLGKIMIPNGMFPMLPTYFPMLSIPKSPCFLEIPRPARPTMRQIGFRCYLAPNFFSTSSIWYAPRLLA